MNRLSFDETFPNLTPNKRLCILKSFNIFGNAKDENMYDTVRVTRNDGLQYEVRNSMTTMASIIISMYEGKIDGYEIKNRDYFDEETVATPTGGERRGFARLIARIRNRQGTSALA